MYSLVLLLHSWIRWIALVAGVGATLAAVRNEVAGEQSLADRWGLALVTTLDLQMLLGLTLYFALSPFTTAAMRDFGAAMKNPQLRFWAVEHLTAMMISVVLVHVGRVLGRKAATPAAKRTRLLVCYGIATLLMMAAIPWPGLANGRPLFRV